MECIYKSIMSSDIQSIRVSIRSQSKCCHILCMIINDFKMTVTQGTEHSGMSAEQSRRVQRLQLFTPFCWLTVGGEKKVKKCYKVPKMAKEYNGHKLANTDVNNTEFKINICFHVLCNNILWKDLVLFARNLHGIPSNLVVMHFTSSSTSRVCSIWYTSIFAI